MLQFLSEYHAAYHIYIQNVICLSIIYCLLFKDQLKLDLIVQFKFSIFLSLSPSLSLTARQPNIIIGKPQCLQHFQAQVDAKVAANFSRLFDNCCGVANKKKKYMKTPWPTFSPFVRATAAEATTACYSSSVDSDSDCT